MSSTRQIFMRPRYLGDLINTVVKSSLKACETIAKRKVNISYYRVYFKNNFHHNKFLFGYYVAFGVPAVRLPLTI